MRGERYKLIRYYDHLKLDYGVEWELFDLKDDPLEQENLLATGEHAETVKKMKK